MPLYDSQAKELIALLQEDQAEIKKLGRDFFTCSPEEYESRQQASREHIRRRMDRALEVMAEVGTPSIGNIGAEAAQALSVLALHDGVALKEVLRAFDDVYSADKQDCYYQAIPAMTDWLLLLERKPQRFATQWLFDDTKQPFLPTTEDFSCVNERRAEYGIEPLRWPKSLAIPESDQPWLTRPLSELTMRDLTDEEYRRLTV